MSRDNGTPPKKDSPENSPEKRHEEFLKRHRARMQKVDEKLDSVRDRAGRSAPNRDKQAGA